VRWPLRRKKTSRERLTEAVLAAVPLSRRELLARVHDPSQDTSRLSFAGGLVLGLVVGIVVALAFVLREVQADEDVRDTELELRPREVTDWLTA
jgi:hypothetical protein